MEENKKEDNKTFELSKEDIEKFSIFRSFQEQFEEQLNFIIFYSINIKYNYKINNYRKKLSELYKSFSIESFGVPTIDQFNKVFKIEEEEKEINNLFKLNKSNGALIQLLQIFNNKLSKLNIFKDTEDINDEYLKLMLELLDTIKLIKWEERNIYFLKNEYNKSIVESTKMLNKLSLKK